MSDEHERKIIPFRDPIFGENESLLGEPTTEELAEAEEIWKEIVTQGKTLVQGALEEVDADWTTKDVAKHVGRSERTVRRWVKDGDLLAIQLKYSGGYRYCRFQFTDLPRLGKRSINPEVIEVKRALDEVGLDPYTQAQFFLTESLQLEGLTPLEIIRRRRLLEMMGDVKQWARSGFGQMGS